MASDFRTLQPPRNLNPHERMPNQLAALEQRCAALERAMLPGSVLHDSSGSAQTGSLGANVIYTHCGLSLDPGTWRIDGWATIYSSDGVADVHALALWDATASALIANSVSAGGGNSTLSLPFYTATVASFTVTTTVRLYGARNGSSTLGFQGGISITPNQRLMATRL